MNAKIVVALIVALFYLCAVAEANRFRGQSPMVELTKGKYAEFMKTTYGDTQVPLETSIAAFCQKFPEFNEEPLYQITCAVAAQYGGAPYNIAYKN